MFQLIYSSVPTADLDQDRLKAIAADASKRNKAQNITGILIMSDGVILQVLEGDETVVRELYAAIEKDRRHSECKLLLERKTKARAFSEWSLGYSNAEDGFAYEMRLLIHALKAKQANRAKTLKMAS